MTMAAAERRAKIWAVIRVSSGNFLEMYDFMVFGYYAAAIGHTFFPSASELRPADAVVHDLRRRLSDAAARAPSCWAPISTAMAGAPACC